MKKICLVLLFIPVPVFAALKCAPLGYSGTKMDGSTHITCTSQMIDDRLDWISTCNSVYVPGIYEDYDAGFETGNFTVRGVAGCSKSGGTAYTTTTDILTTMTSVPTYSKNDDNKACWCKMVTPVVSKWVYIRAYEVAGSCAKSCAYRCAEAMASNDTFRTSLFSSMTD